MYLPNQAPSTQDLRQQAGEIRDYLIEVRGGAPFLSAADAQLLLEWLEQDVPVALIYAAIDRVSARRRKKRVRSRMTLKACKGEVNSALKKQASRHTAGVVPLETPTEEETDSNSLVLQTLVAELSDKPVHPLLSDRWIRLIRSLDELSRESLSVEDRIARTLRLTRDFHRDAWDLMQAHHNELRAAAEEELAHLQGVVSDRIWMDLLEEAARDQLRRQFPWVSADQLWDRLQP